MEFLIWLVVLVFGGAIFWALLTQLARAARRGWEDEGRGVRDHQSDTVPDKTPL